MFPVPAQYHRDQRDGPGGESLFWERAAVDGLPYLGPAVPRTEAQYQAETAPVRIFRNGTFDTADPGQNAAYCDVMTRCCNRWFVLVRQEPIKDTTRVYIEWIERYIANVAGPLRAAGPQPRRPQ